MELQSADTCTSTKILIEDDEITQKHSFACKLIYLFTFQFSSNILPCITAKQPLWLSVFSDVHKLPSEKVIFILRKEFTYMVRGRKFLQ